MTYRRFPALTLSSEITVVAPSGPFPLETFEIGLSRLRQHFEVRHSTRIFESSRYLAGTDAARLAELQQALASPYAAVVAARGGYGLTRLLDQVDFRGLETKALIGFSDFTALHLLAQKHGWQSVHAPVLTQLASQPDTVINQLASILKGQKSEPLTGSRTVVSGIVEGHLLGGNLAILTRLIGTPFLPSFEGAVLLLEDVGERPYQLDRMVTHLKHSGILAQVSGIVLGDFTHCEEKSANFTSSDVMTELFADIDKPCAAGFVVGHGEVNTPVVLGAPVRLDASTATLTFL